MKARNKPQIKVRIYYASEHQVFLDKNIYVYLNDNEQELKYLTQQLKAKLIPAIKKAIEEVKLEIEE